MVHVSKPLSVWCNTCEEIRTAHYDTRKPDLIRCTHCGKDVAADKDRPVPASVEASWELRRWQMPDWKETKFVFEEVLRKEPHTEAPPSYTQTSSRGKKASRRAEARRRRRWAEQQLLKGEQE